MRSQFFNHIAAALAFLVLAGQPTPTVAQRRKADKIAVFVGPQTRDGFVDVDRGIVDSINDIQKEFKSSRYFTVVKTPADATIVLIVAGRRTAGDSGSVGVPIGTAAIFVPIQRRAIDTILRVQTYEKPLTSESGDSDTWRAAARQVVRDVRAWSEANRTALTRR